MVREKIVVVLSVVGRSRHAKRIDMLLQNGFQVQAAAFERESSGSARLPKCHIETLGTISQGAYLRRLVKLVFAIPKLREIIRRNDAVYSFGPDMAFFSILAGIGLARPICVDIADIRKIQVSRGLKGKLVRLMDRIVVRNCKLLVVSAPGFIDGYYRKRIGATIPSLIIENKLEPASIELELDIPKSPCHDTDSITIGYFGMLRCPWSWQVLETLARRHPNRFRVVIAGQSILDFDPIKRTETIENMEYLGPYRSPEDLPELYDQVDLVWACYPPPDSMSPEWRWAQAICRSNRFYESCRFKTPLISIADSGDGMEVARLGIGLTMDNYEREQVIDSLVQINSNTLSQWQQNCAKLSREIYEYSNEGQMLAEALGSMTTQ